jgi:hypothetical protein
LPLEARPGKSILKLMMYFWFIPALVLLLALVWFFYAAATKRAPGRTEGKTLVDKPTGHERDVP